MRSLHVFVSYSIEMFQSIVQHIYKLDEQRVCSFAYKQLKNKPNPNVHLCYVLITFDWGYIGVTQGLHQGYIGVAKGLHWDYVRVTFGLHSCYIGITCGYVGFYIGVTIMLQWDYIGVTLALQRVQIGITLGLHRDYIGITLRLQLGYFGITLRLHWGYIGVTVRLHLGLHWGYIGLYRGYIQELGSQTFGLQTEPNVIQRYPKHTFGLRWVTFGLRYMGVMNVDPFHRCKGLQHL